MAILKAKKVNITQEQLLGQTILLGMEPVYVRKQVEEDGRKRWVATDDVRQVIVRVISMEQNAQIEVPIVLRDYNTNELLVPHETYGKILKLAETHVKELNIGVEFIGFEAEVANETTIRENFNAGADDDKFIKNNSAGYKVTAKDISLKQLK